MSATMGFAIISSTQSPFLISAKLYHINLIIHQLSKMPSPFGDMPKAASLLEFHRVMSPTAGVRVSPLCLGAMNFGDAWQDFMGKCDKKTTFEILDYFYQQGGNFIDTSVDLLI